MKKSTAQVIGTAVLAFGMANALLPIILAILRSLFLDSDLTQFNYFASYVDVFHTPNILPAFLNSIIIAAVSVPLTIFVVVMAAYSFSKFRYKGNAFLYIMILSALMIPPATVMYPCFMTMRRFGLIGKRLAIILCEVAYAIPFNLLTVKNYFDEIPKEMLEAASIDGAGSFRSLWSIIVPTAKPVLFVIIVWSFVNSWNDYLWPMLFFTDSSQKTVTLLPQYFMGNYALQYDRIFAAMLIIMIPTVLIYIILNKYFEQGMVSGAIKG